MTKTMFADFFLLLFKKDNGSESFFHRPLGSTEEQHNDLRREDSQEHAQWINS